MPVPGADWVVGSILPDNDATAKHATQCWPREQEPKLGGAVLMWWTDRPYWAAGRAGAAALRKHGNMQRSHCSYLSTVDGELIDAELSAIELTLHMTIRKREPIQRNGVNMMAVFRNSKAAIRWTADPELGPGQPVASQTYQMRQALLTHDIAMKIQWVPGHSCIPTDEDADCPSNISQEAYRSKTMQKAHTSLLIGARRISEGRSIANP